MLSDKSTSLFYYCYHYRLTSLDIEGNIADATIGIFLKVDTPFIDLWFFSGLVLSRALLGVRLHSKKKSTSKHLFWCFRLSQIENSIEYLEGPNGIWKDHDRHLGVQMDPKMPIMVLLDTIWSFHVLNRSVSCAKHIAKTSRRQMKFKFMSNMR